MTVRGAPDAWPQPNEVTSHCPLPELSLVRDSLSARLQSEV